MTPGSCSGRSRTIGLLPEEFRLLATPVAVIFGITYNFLPFMTLPIYVSLEKIDKRLVEAAEDLYATSFGAFRRITFPLSLPGVFAGSLLTFIPAMGDYVNAELLGNPDTTMIGNVIQNQFLTQNNYPTASALSFLLMAGILIAVAVYARLLGTEELTRAASDGDRRSHDPARPPVAASLSERFVRFWNKLPAVHLHRRRGRLPDGCRSSSWPCSASTTRPARATSCGRGSRSTPG